MNVHAAARIHAAACVVYAKSITLDALYTRNYFFRKSRRTEIYRIERFFRCERNKFGSFEIRLFVIIRHGYGIYRYISVFSGVFEITPDSESVKRSVSGIERVGWYSVIFILTVNGTVVARHIFADKNTSVGSVAKRQERKVFYVFRYEHSHGYDRYVRKIRVFLQPEFRAAVVRGKRKFERAFIRSFGSGGASRYFRRNFFRAVNGNGIDIPVFVKIGKTALRDFTVGKIGRISYFVDIYRGISVFHMNPDSEQFSVLARNIIHGERISVPFPFDEL